MGCKAHASSQYLNTPLASTKMDTVPCRHAAADASPVAEQARRKPGMPRGPPAGAVNMQHCVSGLAQRTGRSAGIPAVMGEWRGIWRNCLTDFNSARLCRYLQPAARSPGSASPREDASTGYCSKVRCRSLHDPRSKCQGEGQNMGHFSLETCAPPGPIPSASQQQSVSSSEITSRSSRLKDHTRRTDQQACSLQASLRRPQLLPWMRMLVFPPYSSSGGAYQQPHQTLRRATTAFP